MKIFEVGCNRCCGAFMETTSMYNPDRPATDNQIRVKKEYNYKKAGLNCPVCGGDLTNGGQFNRMNFLRDEKRAKETPVAVVLPPESDEEEEFAPVTMPVADFNREGRAQCPFCHERPNKQWWTRHMRRNHMDEISK